MAQGQFNSAMDNICSKTTKSLAYMESRYLLYCSCPWNAPSFLSCFVADIGCQLKFTVIVIWPLDIMKYGRHLTLCVSPGAGSLRFDSSEEVIRLAEHS